MTISTFILDTFTTKQFHGNPTGICLLPDDIEDQVMQSIASELNFPVTAFVLKIEEGIYGLRYFTPLTEITACGHATLGAAAVIAKENQVDSVLFKTKTNVSIQTLVKDEMVTMLYPKYELQDYQAPSELLENLGIANYESIKYCPELESVFIELLSPRQLKNIQPDFVKLLNNHQQIKEVVITTDSDSAKYDYLLRSFCPWIGIDEDPVTGSVHSALAPYWGERLNKKRLKAHQASKRGGEFLLTIATEQVLIGGAYVLIMEGKMNI
jgi:PhzF family phenazine biosynthesis protein